MLPALPWVWTDVPWAWVLVKPRPTSCPRALLRRPPVLGDIMNSSLSLWFFCSKSSSNLTLFSSYVFVCTHFFSVVLCQNSGMDYNASMKIQTTEGAESFHGFWMPSNTVSGKLESTKPKESEESLRVEEDALHLGYQGPWAWLILRKSPRSGQVPSCPSSVKKACMLTIFPTYWSHRTLWIWWR